MNSVNPLSSKNLFRIVKERFEAAADPEIAVQMAAYMRNRFEFYGIKTPERRALYRDLISTMKKTAKTAGKASAAGKGGESDVSSDAVPSPIDWTLFDLCFADPHREFQYFACDAMNALCGHMKYEDIWHLKRYIKTKPWWDTIDSITKYIGSIGLRDSRVAALMLEWSTDDDMWIRRTAIEHQLGLKERTNRELLAEIIENNLASSPYSGDFSREFFINKAIGWVLREFSKTDPEWVRDFIDRHREDMATLSVKEGSKYI
ncbi:MAG: DNA alkylation repair protein [Eubacterium sp.]|jgi:3-methyladenine DNA glycosylase AlkD